MPKPRQTTPSAHDFKAAEASLHEAFLALKTPRECELFLRDLCTPQEIKDFVDRWWIARLLQDGELSYRDIHKITGVSLTTIGRVHRFLEQEPYHGYKLVLGRTGKSKKNTKT